MTTGEPAPAVLLSLAEEAFAAIAVDYDTSEFQGAALYNEHKDAIITALPSFAGAKEVICKIPRVPELYGGVDIAGDRLALQFVYQLFPRADKRGIRDHMRRLWDRFLTELKQSAWIYRGIANIRNFSVQPGISGPITLAEGISIRKRSRSALQSLGFNEPTLDAQEADFRSSPLAFSHYVICVEHRVKKEPENIARGDSTGIIAVQRAITAMRLAAHGDVTIGPMWATRAEKFDFGINNGVGRAGWPTTDAGGYKFVLTSSVARLIRNLQPVLARQAADGYRRAPGNFDLALRSFEDTYDRFPRRSDAQMVDTMTAAEALLSSDNAELTFKLSLRAAGVLGRTPTERVKIFNNMKTFYGTRSKFVHGSHLNRTQMQALEPNVVGAREIVRRLLAGYLRLAENSVVNYGNNFLTERIDIVLQDERERRRLMQDLGVLVRGRC